MLRLRLIHANERGFWAVLGPTRPYQLIEVGDAYMRQFNIPTDNDPSPVRRLAIIWTNAAIMSIKPQGTYFGEILFEIQKFWF